MIILKQVDKFILKDCNVHIPKGEVTGIIGASGAGKTTFLKLCAGLLQPEKGNVYTMRLDPIVKRKKLAHNMAVLFANIPVFPEDCSIKSSIEDLGVIYDMKQDRFDATYKMYGERFGYLSFEDQLPKRLSLGQKRRAELGATFMRKPELLILDEPSIGLDQNGKAVLKKSILECKEAGSTVLVSSHDMEEIKDVCDRILVLSEGRILYYGNQELFVKKYAPLEICELTFEGKVPNFEDLPITYYDLENNHLTIAYHSNRISSAEIMEHILKQTKLLNVKMTKADLSTSIKNVIKRGV